MLIRRKRNDKTVVFAEPPWNEDSPPWQAFDRELPPDHLARVVVEQLSVVDLTPLVASYLGTGSKPYRPDLLLRIALIEIQRGRHSPTQWYHDTKENTALQWAGFGIQPSRTCWHHFYDRAAPWLLTWNGNVLAQAQEQGQTTATRAAQDGTLVAANASRHQLLNHERLEKRLAQLDTVLAPAAEAPAAVEALAGVADPAAPQAVLDRAAPAAVAAVLDRAAPAAVAGAAPTAVPQAPPAWMADTPAGRQAQRQRYARARDHLDDLRSANGRRNPAKRLDPKKIVISAGDPQARPGRDKDKVFRPLYNVQLLSDLDAPFYLGYQVFAQTTDANTLGPMFERTTDLVGQKPKVLLVDAGYVTGADLALCDAAGVTV